MAGALGVLPGWELIPDHETDRGKDPGMLGPGFHVGWDFPMLAMLRKAGDGRKAIDILMMDTGKNTYL